MDLQTRNVNTAFRELVSLFDDDPEERVRGGHREVPILTIDEPVTITYTHPKERVLFNKALDANPFFHLYRSLWTLAGRNDVAPLAYYSERTTELSDDGETLNGAYGYRWRRAPICVGTSDKGGGNYWEYTQDQLDILVNHLKADPNSRRAVLQMWNVEDDLMKIGSKCNYCGGIGCNADADLLAAMRKVGDPLTITCPKCKGKGISGQSKDVCCNLSVMFSMREIINGADDQYDRDRGARPPYYVLNMTVINRSSDMIRGMLGTDFMTFSILQEYMAARLGAGVGLYRHFTDNLHVYQNNWKPEEWLAENVISYYGYGVLCVDGSKFRFSEIEKAIPTTFPLVRDPAAFEEELPVFVENFAGHGVCALGNWQEPFFNDVAAPMFRAWRDYKEGYGTQGTIDIAARRIKADDWRTAATNWLSRRAQ